ncbi:hypothetical protein L596_013976 [Steinernema carpocapsae]|nr:hypothetical protein L596_013976 [Steinernema carpocapsae]
MIQPNESEANTIKTAKLPVAEYIEVALNVLAPIWILYFMCLLRRPFFHLNLRILLANFSISLMFLTFSRVIILLAYNGQMWMLYISMVHDACVFSIIDGAALLAGERLVATCLVDNYEKSRNWWIAVVLCLCMWCVNGTFAYFVDILALTEKYEVYYSPILTMFSIMLVMNCFGVGVFLLVNRYNKSRWKVDLQKNLTHRYQIKENIRTSKQLLIALLVDFVISVYFFVIINHRMSMRFTKNWVDDTLSQIFDFSCTLSAFLMPYLFISSHPRLRVIAKKHFYRIKRVNVKQQNEERRKPPGAMAQQEANVYFNQLTSSWDNAKVKTRNAATNRIGKK